MIGSTLGRVASEAAGTALLVGLGTGTIVGAARIGGIPLLAMTVAWFFAVLVPILLFIQISGAHLNPAVTLALAASGRIAWREVPFYFLGQFSGAFLASACVLAALGDVHHLGATLPAHGDLLGASVGEFTFTAALVISVFVLADLGEGPRRWRILLPPTAVAFSTYFTGPVSGSSLNPARTLAPAVLSGTYTDLWMYVVVVPVAALAVAAAWKPRAVDIEDRGPGRRDPSH